MKKISVLALGGIMFVLLSSFLNFIFGDPMDPGTKIAHKICGQISKQLNRKYGLNYMGISEEGPDGKYIRIGLELSYYHLLSKDEGRVLLLNCIEDALQMFNSHPEFKPYMNNYPFTKDNLIVNIYVHPPDNFNVYYPDIAIFGFANNHLEYDTKIPEKRIGFYTEERETLEEARKIVEEQREGKRPFIKREP